MKIVFANAIRVRSVKIRVEVTLSLVSMQLLCLGRIGKDFFITSSGPFVEDNLLKLCPLSSYTVQFSQWILYLCRYFTIMDFYGLVVRRYDMTEK